MTSLYDTVVATIRLDEDISKGKVSTSYSVLSTGLLIPYKIPVKEKDEQIVKTRSKQSMRKKQMGVKIGTSSLNISPLESKDDKTYIKVDRLIFLLRKANKLVVSKMGENLILSRNGQVYRVKTEYHNGDIYVQLTESNMQMLGLEYKGSKLVFLKEGKE